MGLYVLDDRYQIGARLGALFDRGIDRLAQVWDELGDDAQALYRQLENSPFVTDLRRDVDDLARRLARPADRIRAEAQGWW